MRLDGVHVIEVDLAFEVREVHGAVVGRIGGDVLGHLAALELAAMVADQRVAHALHVDVHIVEVDQRRHGTGVRGLVFHAVDLDLRLGLINHELGFAPLFGLVAGQIGGGGP